MPAPKTETYLIYTLLILASTIASNHPALQDNFPYSYMNSISLSTGNYYLIEHLSSKDTLLSIVYEKSPNLT